MATDRTDQALATHARNAAEQGLCPRLHPLSPGGICLECTLPLPPLIFDDGAPDPPAGPLPLLAV